MGKLCVLLVEFITIKRLSTYILFINCGLVIKSWSSLYTMLSDSFKIPDLIIHFSGVFIKASHIRSSFTASSIC